MKITNKQILAANFLAGIDIKTVKKLKVERAAICKSAKTLEEKINKLREFDNREFLIKEGE